MRSGGSLEEVTWELDTESVSSMNTSSATSSSSATSLGTLGVSAFSSC